MKLSLPREGKKFFEIFDILKNAEMEHKKNILIGCTGSVAAIKLPVVLNLLKKRDQTFQVSVVRGSLIFSPFTH